MSGFWLLCIIWMQTSNFSVERGLISSSTYSKCCFGNILVWTIQSVDMQNNTPMILSLGTALLYAAPSVAPPFFGPRLTADTIHHNRYCRFCSWHWLMLLTLLPYKPIHKAFLVPPPHCQNSSPTSSRRILSLSESVCSSALSNRKHYNIAL